MFSSRASTAWVLPRYGARYDVPLDALVTFIRLLHRRAAILDCYKYLTNYFLSDIKLVTFEKWAIPWPADHTLPSSHWRLLILEYVNRFSFLPVPVERCTKLRICFNNCSWYLDLPSVWQTRYWHSGSSGASIGSICPVSAILVSVASTITHTQAMIMNKRYGYGQLDDTWLHNG